MEKLFEIIFSLANREDISKSVFIIFGCALYVLSVRYYYIKTGYDRLNKAFKEHVKENVRDDKECKHFCEIHREKIRDDIRKDLEKKSDKFL